MKLKCCEVRRDSQIFAGNWLSAGARFALATLQLLVAACVMLLVNAHATSAQNWVVAFGDEFNGPKGSAPSTNDWNFKDNHTSGNANGELEFYCAPTDNAAPCSTANPNIFEDGNGNLVIRAMHLASGTWTSGRMDTGGGKHVFTYGRVEARMQLTVGNGLWPAFWMLGQNGVAWPGCGEQDIIEWVPQYGPTVTSSTVHGPGYSGGNGIGKHFTFPNGSTITSFHTYGVVWSQNQMQFYRDDWTKPFFTVTPASIPAGTTWVFNHSFDIITNQAVGGNFPKPGPDGTTPNPSDVLIDYIRQYEPGTGTPPAAPTNLTATAASSSQINLSWTASTTPSVTYDVLRNGSVVATGVTATTFSDTGLQPSTTYSYTVEAVDSGGTSAPSNTASATTGPACSAAPSAPTGLTASTLSSSQIALSWMASTAPSGCSISYTVTRNGTTAGSASGTTFTDNGLHCATEYSYTVTASDAAGSSAASNTASAATGSCPVNGTVQINSGGPAVSPFAADTDFVGGTTINHANTIDLSGVTNPAPMAVYQTARVTATAGAGTSFTYTIPNFTAGSSQLVRLHFAETFHTTAGSRVFNVSINGTQVLADFDIFKTAGANKAVIKEFTVAANASNQYVIVFTTVTDKALISGIEVLPPSTPCSGAPTTPTGLSATAASTTAINLGWTASTAPSGCTITYTVARNSSQIASGVTGTTFSDTGLTCGTTYAYSVTAVDAAGSSSAATASGTTSACTTNIQINSGGPAVSPFVADVDFTGGATINHANTIDLSGVTNPAPMAVYQTARVTATAGAGTTFSYTIPGLGADSSHTVRLHFAETFWTTMGQRVFNVSINGTPVLTDFDIIKTAGAMNKAVIEQFTENANSSGQYVIVFTTVTDKALVSGIEVQ